MVMSATRVWRAKFRCSESTGKAGHDGTYTCNPRTLGKGTSKHQECNGHTGQRRCVCLFSVHRWAPSSARESVLKIPWRVMSRTFTSLQPLSLHTCIHVHTCAHSQGRTCRYIYTRTFYILHSAVALEGGVVLSDLKILDNTWHNYGSHSKNSMNSVWKCFKISALTCSGRRMGRILGVLDKKKSENVLIFMVHEHFV